MKQNITKSQVKPNDACSPIQPSVLSLKKHCSKLLSCFWLNKHQKNILNQRKSLKTAKSILTSFQVCAAPKSWWNYTTLTFIILNLSAAT